MRSNPHRLGFLRRELIAHSISWFHYGVSVMMWDKNDIPSLCYFATVVFLCHLATLSQKCFLQHMVPSFKDGKKQKALDFEQSSEVYKMHSCIWTHLILMNSLSCARQFSFSPFCRCISQETEWKLPEATQSDRGGVLKRTQVSSLHA